METEFFFNPKDCFGNNNFRYNSLGSNIIVGYNNLVSFRNESKISEQSVTGFCFSPVVRKYMQLIVLLLICGQQARFLKIILNGGVAT